MIVVTGAAGFIGGHLVRHLRERGHDVVGIDRRGGADVLADLTDPAPASSDIRGLLREAEAVFHLAGAGGVRLDGPDAEATWWRCNVLATEAVLAVVPPATPLVVTSSSSVYGGTAGGRASRESDRLRPRGGYARSKAEVERRVAARRAGGGRAVVARPFTVAGEGQRPDMALARWIAAARAGEPLRVHGSTARRRDVTDVRQVARALADLAARDVVGTVNLGTGVAHTLGDMVRAVAAAVGPTGVVVEPTHRHDPDATLADTRRCRRLLGFTPTTDLPALVRRQAQAAGAAEAAAVGGRVAVPSAGA